MEIDGERFKKKKKYQIALATGNLNMYGEPPPLRYLYEENHSCVHWRVDSMPGRQKNIMIKN